MTTTTPDAIPNTNNENKSTAAIGGTATAASSATNGNNQLSFPRKVWRLLVAIKDGLALLFLLMFFGALSALLMASPNPARVTEGALLLELDGWIVEEEAYIDPLAMLLSEGNTAGQYSVHDLTHALDEAASDDRIKAVVLDLTRFAGGGRVHLESVAESIDRVRAADKPVLVYAGFYGDSALLLSAHASEVWVNPLGGAAITGPGGENVYFGDFLKRFKIDANVYRAGTFKSAVEPYIRNSMSPEARENAQQIYGALWQQWQDNVSKARPKANIKLVSESPAEWAEQSSGNLAQAAKNAGLVDRIGNEVAFGARVKEIAGDDQVDQHPGAYAHTDLGTWLADNPREQNGAAIGVVTIAGEIVDGMAGPGTAGGKRIAEVLDDALQEDLAALVVRVDSPGGSVTASEEIRLAILRHKAQGIPIVVSMANVAASGGYWVSTPADRIFAEPSTVTGSIGVFSVIPSFEGLAAEYGISTDGVKTTPLTGQPDMIGGFSPEINTLLQQSVESIYTDFLSRVSRSRGMTNERVDEIGQGRVWDGGTARQLGLVDEFGGLEEALAYAAKQAELEGDWYPLFLGQDSGSYRGIFPGIPLAKIAGELGADNRAAAQPYDAFALMAQQQRATFAQFQTNIERLSQVQGAQAYCMECPPLGNAPPGARTLSDNGNWLAALQKLVLSQ